jgi:hypothetical protein
MDVRERKPMRSFKCFAPSPIGNLPTPNFPCLNSRKSKCLSAICAR